MLDPSLEVVEGGVEGGVVLFLVQVRVVFLEHALDSLGVFIIVLIFFDRVNPSRLAEIVNLLQAARNGCDPPLKRGEYGSGTL